MLLLMRHATAACQSATSSSSCNRIIKNNNRQLWVAVTTTTTTLASSASSSTSGGAFFFHTRITPQMRKRGGGVISLEEPLSSRRASSLSSSSSTTTKPSSGKVPSRNEQLMRLKASSRTKPFDILVVGGGATGAGAALDAVTRGRGGAGLNTALVERGDFGHETSSRSTKLIWAGLRYIATALASLLRFRNLTRPVAAAHDFGSEWQMVRAAHKERRVLLENNPHLTQWVPIAVPMNAWLSWPPPFGHPIFATSPLALPFVFKVYDAMSGFTCPPSHIMGKKRAKRKFPQLDSSDSVSSDQQQDSSSSQGQGQGGVKYFQVFYEGMHNDARTATYIALTAAEQGAAIANYVEMIGLLRNNDEDDNNATNDSHDRNKSKATGIRCRDSLTGEEFDVHAKAIIFAGGPFTDSLRRMEMSPSSSDNDFKPAVAAAAGIHIVLPGYYCPGGIGMLDMNTSDGRFLFFLPWQGSTIVGTTDRKGEATSSPEPPEDEIQWILAEVEKYLSPEVKVRRADVLSAWQGFRPLATDPNAPDGAPVSRDHVISTNPDTGVTFITGGKWTTYRQMAEEVVDRVIKLHGLQQKAGPCITDKLPLRGGVGYTRNVPILLVQEFGVSEETAKHLARTYGMHAFEVCRLATPTGKQWPRFGNLLVEGYPYLDCEVEYACKNEMVCTLKDMLTLRMRLAYLNKEAALAVAPKVADLMAEPMGWSRRERNQQLKEAVEYIELFGGPYPNKDEDRLSSSASSTVTDARKLFQTLDALDTGYIDVKMLGVAFKSDEVTKRAFDEIDKNGNGRITEDEFIEWWNDKNSRDKLKEKLDEKFKFSTNNLSEEDEGRGVGFG